MNSPAISPLGEEITLALRALGSEPYLIEAVSKVLALLVPDDVPLMPRPARTFVLGKASAREPARPAADHVAYFPSAARSSATYASTLARSRSRNESMIPRNFGFAM